jgi:hypothetical protein
VTSRVVRAVERLSGRVYSRLGKRFRLRFRVSGLWFRVPGSGIRANLNCRLSCPAACPPRPPLLVGARHARSSLRPRVLPHRPCSSTGARFRVCGKGVVFRVQGGTASRIFATQHAEQQEQQHMIFQTKLPHHLPSLKPGVHLERRTPRTAARRPRRTAAPPPRPRLQARAGMIASRRPAPCPPEVQAFRMVKEPDLCVLRSWVDFAKRRKQATGTACLGGVLDATM